MMRLITYSLLLLWLFSGCEDIYDPKIDAVENVLVTDARIVYGENNNYVRINKSQGFNDKDLGYPSISGGELTIIDSSGKEYDLPEVETGVFSVNFQINPELRYKLKIDYLGDTFESSFESVPQLPDLDTVYGIAETKISQSGGENSVNDFRQVRGVRLYADNSSETEMQYYRFTARKVLQYVYIENLGSDILPEIYHYKWKSFFPQGTFNIAAPPEYSSSNEIIKHPLFFIEESVFMEEDNFFAGWILIFYQYGLSKSAYNYYADLNKQLESEGRIFDPLYVQARNNLKCINNPEELILGNFEISTVTEHRYFVKFISEQDGYKIEPISNRIYIPLSGETIETPPDFWER